MSALLKWMTASESRAYENIENNQSFSSNETEFQPYQRSKNKKIIAVSLTFILAVTIFSIVGIIKYTGKISHKFIYK